MMGNIRKEEWVTNYQEQFRISTVCAISTRTVDSQFDDTGDVTLKNYRPSEYRVCVLRNRTREGIVKSRIDCNTQCTHSSKLDAQYWRVHTLRTLVKTRTGLHVHGQ